MPKDWDDSMKRLIRENPQHFVSWVLPGAVFKRAMSIELKNRTRETDYLPEATLNEEDILVDFEFQSRDDTNMEHRLLEYNVLATLEHNRRVLTCVIYLRKDSNIAESPLIWTLPNGRETLRFYFIVIRLWEIPAEEIIQRGLLGLLPLVPLTKDGKRHELVKEMITELAAAQKYELLSQAKTIAGLVFTDTAEREWLERSFVMYRDIIEESWVYQENIQKGVEKERQQELQRQRQALVTIVQRRFPEIIDFTKKQTDALEDPELLQNLIVQISLAQNVQEALLALITLDKSDKKN
ncbi:MAG: hypothetical protein ACJ8CB_33625 [Ktedonobacteraceae bacterium]